MKYEKNFDLLKICKSKYVAYSCAPIRPAMKQPQFPEFSVSTPATNVLAQRTYLRDKHCLSAVIDVC